MKIMMKKTSLIVVMMFIGALIMKAADKDRVYPRVLISTDIGGTDPDDNQSMAHLLMYSNLFDLEGLVSSPSFGNGSKNEILRMIDLYENDLPKLKKRLKWYPSPQSLRAICKQGRSGSAPYRGFDTPTEGSEWIVKCARAKSDKPLWVLVWGGLEDLAQALHDAPDIQQKIRVYWIGGPNKKWSANSYAYIASNFPDLWFIENNASYRGFIGNTKLSGKYNNEYYKACIENAGSLGADFIKYYDGNVKMGDSPSLFYLMDGDSNNPVKECWGGSFEPLRKSSRIVLSAPTTLKDTIPVYSIIEFHLQGPVLEMPIDTPCFKMTIDKQTWDGFYQGNGLYAIRYSPKAPAILSYTIFSDIPGFTPIKGEFVVGDLWPGNASAQDFSLGNNWYSDKQDQSLFEGKWQGSKTTSKWRVEILSDWEKRWNWLK